HADLPTHAHRPAHRHRRLLPYRDASARPRRVSLSHARWTKRNCDGIGRPRGNRTRQSAAETYTATPQIVLSDFAQQTKVGRTVAPGITLRRRHAANPLRFHVAELASRASLPQEPPRGGDVRCSSKPGTSRKPRQPRSPARLLPSHPRAANRRGNSRPF